MAGLNVSGAGGGGRRALDAEINAVPMVDLMMVTISFLLITAVWSNMGRLESSAQVPSSEPAPVVPEAQVKSLEVEAKPDKFVLTWRRGSESFPAVDVARDEGGSRAARFPALAAEVARSWRSDGEHRDPSDRRLDRAVVKVHDRMPYKEIVAVMDAVQSVRRPRVERGAQGMHSADGPAFELVLGR